MNTNANWREGESKNKGETKEEKIRKHALYRMIYRNSRETSEKNN